MAGFSISRWGRNLMFTQSIKMFKNKTNTILDIIHRPVFHLKHNVSETGFCLHLPVEPMRLGPIDGARK
jgi:hypothetical protein